VVSSTTRISTPRIVVSINVHPSLVRRLRRLIDRSPSVLCSRSRGVAIASVTLSYTQAESSILRYYIPVCNKIGVRAHSTAVVAPHPTVASSVPLNKPARPSPARSRPPHLRKRRRPRPQCSYPLFDKSGLIDVGRLFIFQTCVSAPRSMFFFQHALMMERGRLAHAF
ncbi:unnamed protein product, partial [Ectocarpus sp. 4 AP-2014]